MKNPDVTPSQPPVIERKPLLEAGTLQELVWAPEFDGIIKEYYPSMPGSKPGDFQSDKLFYNFLASTMLPILTRMERVNDDHKTSTGYLNHSIFPRLAVRAVFSTERGLDFPECLLMLRHWETCLPIMYSFRQSTMSDRRNVLLDHMGQWDKNGPELTLFLGVSLGKAVQRVFQDSYLNSFPDQISHNKKMIHTLQDAIGVTEQLMNPSAKRTD